MKRFICIALSALMLMTLLASCVGESIRETLTENVWVSDVDILQFTDKGKLLRNFEEESQSVSYYKLLKDGRIILYTEEGEEYGMEFDIRIEDGKLYLGKVEYRSIEPSLSSEGEME